MFDIGWSEMAVIMLLALIVIGPKDLPRVARTIGQWVRKGRMLAREFQNSLEEMARETELDDVRKEIEKVGRTDFKKTVERTIDPKGELTKAFDVSKDAREQPSAKPETTPITDDKTGAKAIEAAEAQPPSGANGQANGKAAATAAAKTTAATAAAKTTPTKTTTAAPAAAKTAASKPKKTTTGGAGTSSPAKKTGTRSKTSASNGTAAKKPAAASRSTKRSPAKKTAAGDTAPPEEPGAADPGAIAAKPS